MGDNVDLMLRESRLLSSTSRRVLETSAFALIATAARYGERSSDVRILVSHSYVHVGFIRTDS